MKALVIGNSNVASLKLAFDNMLSSGVSVDLSFFCARGSDLFFTKLEGGRIVETDADCTCIDRFRLFSPDSAVLYEYRRRPTASIVEQFLCTGGSPDIDLLGVSQIFYVGGVSPFDFLRTGLDPNEPIPAVKLKTHLDVVLNSGFLLRELVLSIMAAFPSCRHHFIGAPLPAALPGSRSHDRAAVVRTREAVGAMVNGFLFDTVFMPSEDVLDDTLLSTKAHFCVDGCRQAALFQGKEPTGADMTHMNKAYGAIVLRNFVLPALSPLS